MLTVASLVLRMGAASETLTVVETAPVASFTLKVAVCRASS
jgi:hypothetical protein